MSMNEPGGGAAAPVASPAAPSSGGFAAPPAAGGAASSPGASPVQQPIELLRREYETTKSKLEPWEKLGAKPEEVGKSHQTYTKIFSEATNLATQLGYESQELQEAFEQDPVGTLAFLRQAVQKANGAEKPLTRADVQQLADKIASDKLKPFQQERELALDQKAEQAFDGEFDRQFKTSFPDDLPESNKEALKGLAWSLLSEDKDAYGALRSKGDVAKVQAAFESAKKTLLKIVADYGTHERKRVGGKPPDGQGEGNGNRKPQSLDDMINRLGNRNIPDSEIFAR